MCTITLQKIRIVSALSEHKDSLFCFGVFFTIKGQFVENKITLTWILANPAE